MMTYSAAQEQILAALSPLPDEQVELSIAAGRVLSEDLCAGRALPPWDNAAMDGYAVRAADVATLGALPVVGVIAAGDTSQRELPPGCAVRIMTGAPVPDGADAVVMREQAHEEEDPTSGARVRFDLLPRPGAHVRRAGEDMAQGEIVLVRGTPLGPGELGLLAALSRTLVRVHRRPLVAIVSTGDELVPADRAPSHGQIVGSNAHALAAQVAAAGGVPWVLPFAPDRREALLGTFAAALRADAVLSSGGVSVGEFDHVKRVLGELGVEERFWQVAMKPGRPVTFGVRPGRDTAEAGVPVFGLPGNPASSMVSFELFVWPALRRLQGHPPERLRRPVAPVTLTAPVLAERRLHLQRARLVRDAATGRLRATPLSRQGSGMLRSMVGVDALIEVPPGEGTIPAGTEVLAHLLAQV